MITECWEWCDRSLARCCPAAGWRETGHPVDQWTSGPANGNSTWPTKQSQEEKTINKSFFCPKWEMPNVLCNPVALYKSKFDAWDLMTACHTLRILTLRSDTYHGVIVVSDFRGVNSTIFSVPYDSFLDLGWEIVAHKGFSDVLIER